MNVIFAPVLACIALLLPMLAHATASTSCETQLKQLLATRVDCVLNIQSSFIKDVIAVSNGAIQSASCRIPLTFEKSAMYNRWIKPEALQLPQLRVECNVHTLMEDALSLSANIKPMCSRLAQNPWQCQLNMSNTQGLGVLGSLLETQINNSQLLQTKMSQFLMSLEHPESLNIKRDSKK